MMLNEGDMGISNNKHLRCIEKARMRTCCYGIQPSVEDHGDPSSNTVEDFLVNF